MGDSVTFFRAPTDPLLALLPEQSCTVRLDLQWMVRILDVQRALTARGYAPGRSAELHLRVHDDLFRENDDRFILRVENGIAHVERGGTGSIEMNIKGLASLYAGYRTAEQLITSDLLSSSADDAGLATSLFAGRLPWMVDQF
jgi:predicted acetyltransferase